MSNDEESLNNAVKAALIGGAVTFLLNAVVGVWVVSRVNTVNTVIKNELSRVRNAQSRLEGEVTELEVRTAVIESRMDNYHDNERSTTSGIPSTGLEVSFSNSGPLRPSPRDSTSDSKRRGKALREETERVEGTK